MPRIRTIKPQFWIDEHLGSISREARLLYIGLWNLSDDQGVFEYRPARIKAQLFPYDTDLTAESITKWLEELSKVGDIVVFGTNGDTFGFIPTFMKHQQIEKPSKWHFAEIPAELLNNHSQHSPTSTQLVVECSDTTQQPLSLGNREKEKEQVIGNREKEISDYAENSDKNFGEICTIYENNIGQLTGLMSDDLKIISDEYSAEWFKEACLIACRRNVRKLSYIRPILEDWKVNGFKNDKKKSTISPSGKTRRYVN